jgi:HEAT repeat protein
MAKALRRSVVAGLVAAVACGSALTAWGDESNRPEGILLTSDTLESRIAAIRGTASDSQRTALFYDLMQGIERGQINVRTADEAESLARFMADRVEHDTQSVLRWQAADFLARYPHPAAAPALLRAAGQAPEVTTRGSARQALVALRDRRVLPLLVADLRGSGRQGNEQAAIRLMAELGDPAAREPLAALAADSRADPRSRDAARRALRTLSLEPSMVNAFDLDDETLGELSQRGFAIRPADVNEMYELYTGGYPLVTTDLAFHTFVLLLRATLDELERLVLAPRIGDLSHRLAAACVSQARDLGKSDLAPLARQNAAFFAVAADLLGDGKRLRLALPPKEAQQVATEVERIRAHSTIEKSALFDYEEDYTKYKPRGRHGSPELSGYFGAVTFYGRTMFRIDSTDETRRALLILEILARNPVLRREWEEIDRLLSLLFGERDDLAFPDYELAAGEFAGGRATVDYRRQAADTLALAELTTHLRSRPAPRINTAYLPWPESIDWRNRTTGLRIFGQRYTRPISLLQSRLDAGEWPLSGLLVAADLLGSGRASSILGEKAVPSSVPPPPADPYSSLGEGFIHVAGTLFDLPPGAPAFMKRPAWEEKQINTALGAWAEVQHTTAAYTKDANQYASASMMADRFHGYVEPYPRYYRYLNQLVGRVREHLDACDLFGRIERDRAADLARLDATLTPGSYEGKVRRDVAAMRVEPRHFEDLSAILDQLERMAAKELRNEPQSVEDGVFLKSLYSRLRELAFNRSNSPEAPRSMAAVIDVATEYMHDECLEVGVGRPAILYAAIPDGGKTFVCLGAIYTYYEFTRPATKRLNDGEWQALLAERGTATPSPWLSIRVPFAYPGSASYSPRLSPPSR